MAKKGELFNQNSKKKDVRTLNIESAKAVADAVRTSLGPRGMDKMVCLCVLVQVC
jgi:T-complex protein 1 subunit delta